MLVHFPISLVLLAALVDLARLARAGAAPAWLGTVLLGVGAVSSVAALVSGWAASGTVRIPGMAHGLVQDHRNWALATTVALGVFAVGRIVGGVRGAGEDRLGRLILVLVSLAMALMIQQTAERGARLVYEQGVGVIPARNE